MRMSGHPDSAKISASLRLPAVSPDAPASSCIRPMRTLLCVFTCGRSFFPCRPAKDCIRSILRPTTSMSTMGAGVLTWLPREFSTDSNSSAWSKTSDVDDISTHLHDELGHAPSANYAIGAEREAGCFRSDVCPGPTVDAD